MKVTLSLQRFRKIKSLSTLEFGILCDLIKKGGIIDVDAAVKGESFSGLRSKGFIRSRSGKAWVNFEVNGQKPSPFVGLLRPKKARPELDNRKVAAVFAREYEKATGKKYGLFSKTEWALLTKLAKDFDLFELELMLQEFFLANHATEITMLQFCKRKNSLYRAVAGRAQDENIGRGASRDRGWESFPEIHTRGNTEKVSRREGRRSSTRRDR